MTLQKYYLSHHCQYLIYIHRPHQQKAGLLQNNLELLHIEHYWSNTVQQKNTYRLANPRVRIFAVAAIH